MKRNVILMVLGVVMAMMLSSCAQGAPASIVGTWDITGGTMYYSSYTEQYLEIKENGDMFWIRDGYGSNNPYYTIKTNSCNELSAEDDAGSKAKFNYELAGDSLTLKLNTSSGLVNALLPDWAVCKKR